MANTTVATANQVEQWSAKFFREYIRDSAFKPYMGTSQNAVIQTIEDLSKKAGDKVTVSLIQRLTNAGITGDSTLEGNEEALVNYGHQLTVDALANAVRVGKMERMKTVIDLLEAAREMLKFWAMDQLRDDVIAALLSPNVDGSTAYASCSEAQKDAWSVANSDRLLFGAAVGNYSGDHSADLAKVDSTTDVLDEDIVSLAKRIAKTADPHIRPIRTKGGEEWFVMFCNSLAFRDLKSSMKQSNREAWTRGKENPLFRDGDLLYDGVICREVPEIAVLSGVGNSGIDVAPNFLCGAQAVGLAWAQRSKFATKDFDYGRQKGVALDEVRGIEKLMYNEVQNGVVTVYASGVADA